MPFSFRRRFVLICCSPFPLRVSQYLLHGWLALCSSQNRACAINAHGSSLQHLLLSKVYVHRYLHRSLAEEADVSPTTFQTYPIRNFSADFDGLTIWITIYLQCAHIDIAHCYCLLFRNNGSIRLALLSAPSLVLSQACAGFVLSTLCIWVCLLDTFSGWSSSLLRLPGCLLAPSLCYRLSAILLIWRTVRVSRVTMS